MDILEVLQIFKNTNRVIDISISKTGVSYGFNLTNSDTLSEWQYETIDKTTLIDFLGKIEGDTESIFEILSY